MTSALPALLLAVAGASPAGPQLHPLPPGHAGETRCGSCHTAEGWSDVRFAHERTGFPLEGKHVQVGCRSCHPNGFQAPVQGACAACHLDPHRGELGARCASCHDAVSWESRFDADAHRRTNFPLSGRHAFIPCEECHGDQRDRRFSRVTSTCYDCHQADYLRAALVSIDHAAAGFGRNCRECHDPFRFVNGFFPGHDTCFQITGGPHAGIPCLACHTSLRGVTVNGTCSTNTASCTRCHRCTDMATRHAGVAGFQCTDRKCYECHRFTTTGALRLAPGAAR